jgi:uncharacterized protein (DUF488 family)
MGTGPVPDAEAVGELRVGELRVGVVRAGVVRAGKGAGLERRTAPRARDKPDAPSERALYTVGHADHPIDEFVELLRAFGIRVLADVRRAPGSRHAPQFNGDALAASLGARGIRYVHVPELGGWRTTRPDSPNGTWTNRSFRGYADHMATPEFERGMDRLLSATAPGPTACMCAEGLWWRCHRRLLSDALIARGHGVVHILPDGRHEPHSLTAGAVAAGSHVSYPPQQQTLGI